MYYREYRIDVCVVLQKNCLSFSMPSVSNSGSFPALRSSSSCSTLASYRTPTAVGPVEPKTTSTNIQQPYHIEDDTSLTVVEASLDAVNTVNVLWLLNFSQYVCVNFRCNTLSCSDE